MITPVVVAGGEGYTAWVDAVKRVGQKFVHASGARFRVVSAGRQSGKTRLAIVEICEDAMSHGGHVNWWVTVNLEIKATVWRELLDFLPPEVIKGKPNKVERRIELTNGSQIFVKSAAGDDSLTSAALNFLVCDEAALWKHEAWSRGVEPMLVARPDSRVLLISTPRGHNWFYRLWQLGDRRGCVQCDKDRTKCSVHDPDYDSFTWKTEDSPYADLAFLAAARRTTPEDIYAQEYEANPLDSSGGVFKRVRDRVSNFPFQADEATVLGVDVGQAVDFTAIIPMNSARQALYCKRTQDDWPVQTAIIVSESIRNKFARVVADSISKDGDAFISTLRQAGLAVQAVPTTSAAIKTAVINTLRLAFEQGTLQIPNDAVLVEELEAYTYKIDSETGHVSYFGPEGHHDDTVMALALAYWGQKHTVANVSPKKEDTYVRSRDGLRERQRRYVH